MRLSSHIRQRMFLATQISWKYGPFSPHISLLFTRVLKLILLPPLTGKLRKGRGRKNSWWASSACHLYVYIQTVSSSGHSSSLSAVKLPINCWTCKKIFLEISIQELILSHTFYFIALTYQGLSGFWFHHSSLAFENLTSISYENLTSFSFKSWRGWSQVLHKHATRSFCYVLFVKCWLNARHCFKGFNFA